MKTSQERPKSRKAFFFLFPFLFFYFLLVGREERGGGNGQLQPLRETEINYCYKFYKKDGNEKLGKEEDRAKRNTH